MQQISDLVVCKLKCGSRLQYIYLLTYYHISCTVSRLSQHSAMHVILKLHVRYVEQGIYKVSTLPAILCSC